MTLISALVRSCSFGRGDALGAALVFEQDRRQRFDLRRSGARRLAVGIDVLGLELRGLVLVLLQPILVDVLAIVALEHGDLHRFLQVLEDLDRLIRQAVDLVGGQVPALVLARAEVVDGDEDAEEHDDADDGHGAVPGAASLVELGDVAPLAGHVDQHRDQARPRGVGRVLIPVRIEHADRDGAEHQHRADPTDDAENFLHD